MKRVSRLGLSIVLALLILLFTATPALAWHHNGYYWLQGPEDLYFLIEDDVSTESWTGWYNGHEEWNEAEDSPTEFIYTENPSIDVITCEYGYSPDTWAGYTWFSPPSPGAINYAGVMMNERLTDYYAYYKRVAVAGHEFGHTLGLAHNSGQYLMDPFIDNIYDTYGIYQPTATDVAEVNALY